MDERTIQERKDDLLFELRDLSRAEALGAEFVTNTVVRVASENWRITYVGAKKYKIQHVRDPERTKEVSFDVLECERECLPTGAFDTEYHEFCAHELEVAYRNLANSYERCMHIWGAEGEPCKSCNRPWKMLW